MIQTFFIVTIAACVIGVIVYLAFTGKKKEMEEEYKNIPIWMKDENFKQGICPGEYVLNISNNNPYAKYGDIGFVTSVDTIHAWVGWPDKDHEIPTPKSTIIRAPQVKEIKKVKIFMNEPIKPSKKIEVKMGSLVDAEFSSPMGGSGQKVIGTLIRHNRWGSLVVQRADGAEISIDKIIRVIKPPKKK